MAKVVVIGSVVLAVLLLVAGAWWWRTEQAFVGGVVPAELSWGDCVNSIHWTDPGSGTRWWGGEYPVIAENLETEPRRVRPNLGGPAWPPRTERRAQGEVRFDSADHATFTSTAGGTLPLERVRGSRLYLGQCAGDGRNNPPPSHAVGPLLAEARGVLGRTGQPPTLMAGTVRVEQDGTEVARAESRNGLYFVWVPTDRPVTLIGNDGSRDCSTVTRAFAPGDHTTVDLLCP